MRKTKNIWSIKCTATDQDFAITKYTDNIVLNLRTLEVNVVVLADKKDYDLILNEKYYKIIDTFDVFDLKVLSKLFEGRSIKFKKK